MSGAACRVSTEIPSFKFLLGATQCRRYGYFAIELEDCVRTEQSYEENTAILRTTLHGKQGSLRVTDFALAFGCVIVLSFRKPVIRRLEPIAEAQGFESAYVSI